VTNTLAYGSTELTAAIWSFIVVAAEALLERAVGYLEMVVIN
jgi:hypothetical protein